MSHMDSDDDDYQPSSPAVARSLAGKRPPSPTPLDLRPNKQQFFQDALGIPLFEEGGICDSQTTETQWWNTVEAKLWDKTVPDFDSQEEWEDWVRQQNIDHAGGYEWLEEKRRERLEASTTPVKAEISVKEEDIPTIQTIAVKDESLSTLPATPAATSSSHEAPKRPGRHRTSVFMGRAAIQETPTARNSKWSILISSPSSEAVNPLPRLNTNIFETLTRLKEDHAAAGEDLKVALKWIRGLRDRNELLTNSIERLLEDM
ncbi:hypothetical protein BKA70DRAFT_1276989 [Coprinopsis sp. MPI-PUGE-AT-0042]|nr:hypothetical protein BKA70DRAFT_1276989 [Coprinopsis sp. MPI-PUGE-AT-0042]